MPRRYQLLVRPTRIMLAVPTFIPGGGRIMDAPAISGPARILVIGRSPRVILDTADILRSRGFDADATNQFDAVLTDYDTTNLDVVVFGGMVPQKAKQHLRDEISKVNGH